MASISTGPNGLAINNGSDCPQNSYLADQTNPLGALIERLTEQHMTGMTKVKYPDMAMTVDRHMPMQPVTSARIDGNITYRTGIGYEGLLNDDSLKNITPATSGYTNPIQLLTGCGDLRDKNIGMRGNTQTEACNPVIDGPLPILGREEYGRQAFTSRMSIPAFCMADYVNKENFLAHLTALLDLVQNATITRFSAGLIRWILSKTRFNAAPYQVSQGNGTAKLPVSSDLFSSFTFPRVPTHWGSFEWIAGMLRLSEIPRRENLRVALPVSIFKKYKEQYITQVGINIYEGAQNLTRAINGFVVTIQNETFIYQDEVTGRKITFEATTEPTYVEVKETLEGGGEWRFQEPWIFRDSETANNVMPRENPVYGVACACPDSVLAAVVMVSPDDSKPFHREPLPGNNPSEGVREVINRYAASKGAQVNTNLAQMYPAAVTTTLLTGLDAQVYMLDPINRRYRDAGYACDVANNVKGTWFGGFTEISVQAVEDNPRVLTAFLLLVPPPDTCVDLAVPCAGPPVIPANGAFDPNLAALNQTPAEIPEPVEPDPLPAGEIFVVGRKSTFVADCTENKTVQVRFERRGGTAGSISATVSGAGTAHVNGAIPGTVTFADGETVKYLEFSILPWTCASPPEDPETFILTFGGAGYSDDAIETRRICIKCNSACPSECESGEGCPTC